MTRAPFFTESPTLTFISRIVPGIGAVSLTDPVEPCTFGAGADAGAAAFGAGADAGAAALTGAVIG